MPSRRHTKLRTLLLGYHIVHHAPLPIARIATIQVFSRAYYFLFLYKQRQNDIMNGSMLPYNDKEQPNYP